ncbi:hypothetical protein RHMOL_Rhmol02G0044900 [Rhododendron molle]|uniref:Uncharacterized protein n=1 Tax=Rhododendron molle TaxID=49168 RepID=A0ACC0PPP3_RHOML|nr:hypothetical protein RHMOL_Rhmol02G0044900 [Rhododendron molle]
MATPSHGGDSDKAIPKSLPPPSVMESCASLQQEDIVDQSPCSASDSAYLQQLLEHWLQQEEIVDQSRCSASDLALLQQELPYGNRYDASDMSRPTDFTGETSFNCATWSGATRHNESYATTLGYDEVEEVGTRSEGRGEGEMEGGHLNSAGCFKKGKRKVRSPRGERGNKKRTGARIEISLDDILPVEQMRLQEAARHLKVSASTLKRVCREHGIHRWPPRMGKDCINQSGPSESLLTVDQEGIAQQRPDTPRSDTPRMVMEKGRGNNSSGFVFL